LVAAKYQIMVMGMVFGSGGISAACFLMLLRPAPAATGVDAIG
jgi:ABC-type iron transport system FetAB permease component